MPAMPVLQSSDANDIVDVGSDILKDVETSPTNQEAAAGSQVPTNGESLQPEFIHTHQPVETDRSELTSKPAVEAPDGGNVTTKLPGRRKIDDTDTESSDGERRYDVGMELAGHRISMLGLRRKAARKRLLQTVSYAALMEDRMKAMELEIVELRQMLGENQGAKGEAREKVEGEEEEKKEKDKEEEKEEEEESSAENYELAACPIKMTWAQFNSKSSKPTHIIDLLVEKPGPCDNSLRLGLASPARFRQRLKVKPRPEDGQETSRIERIRINSKPLCEVMEEVMGKDVAPAVGVQILRPFKALFAYHSDLTKRCQELRAEDIKDVSTSPTFDGSSGADDVRSADSEVSGGISAQSPIEAKIEEQNITEDQKPLAEDAQPNQKPKLRHLEALLKMMGQELRNDLETDKKYRNREHSVIRFDDLWHLFAPGKSHCIALSTSANSGCSGDVIYNPFEVEAYQVLSVYNGREIRDYDSDSDSEIGGDINRRIKGDKAVKRPFVVDMVKVEFDGEGYGPTQFFRRIDPFQGEKRITDLDVYPIEYGLAKNVGRNSAAATLKQDISLRDALHERGARFQELAKTKQIVHCAYRGMTLDRVPEQVDSHVIIDTSYYYETHASEIPRLGSLDATRFGDAREVVESCCCRDIDCEANLQSYHDDRKVEEERMDSFINENIEWLGENGKIDGSFRTDQRFLLPKQLWGFVLNSRSWHPLDINRIDNIGEQTQSFEQLVLNPEHKKLIESQVTMHSTGIKPASGSVGQAENDRREDLVRGKGKGLIILLHGAPGVGKTSTAECVAEYTNRPLLSITCGDIGDTALDVQENLASNLSLAHRWGCVMLLDEADVFLSARSKTDMKRNAVVSVFLRMLEYYSGILFLTTNKVGTIDEAFKSRIHLSLFYPSLDAEQTMKIWRLNLQRIRNNKKGVVFEMEDLVHWASRQWDSCKSQRIHPWNGRQIRNACQTAAALAEFDNNGVITTTHLKAVANASSEFDRYLKQVWGGDDAHRAKINNERQDGFRPLERASRPIRDDYRDYHHDGIYDSYDSYAEAYHEPSQNSREPRRRPTFSRRSSQTEFYHDDDDYDSAPRRDTRSHTTRGQDDYREDSLYGDSRRGRNRDWVNMPPPPKPQGPRFDDQGDDRQRPDSRRGNRRPSRARDHGQD